MAAAPFANPFRPGAGHMPPYLAGRQEEALEFRRLLRQTVIMENLLLTGLRGVGKTVLLESFKPVAIQESWLWVGNDLSESISISEEMLATRIITDISVITSGWTLTRHVPGGVGFNSQPTQESIQLNFTYLSEFYKNTPGLTTDKLKALLEHVWSICKSIGRKGIIFAYDEAQNLSDSAAKDQYPLSTLLDVFQSIQRKGVPFMLALVGLPTLLPKLVDARTYTERMFRVVSITRLDRQSSSEAITKPVASARCTVKFADATVDRITDISGGYPYFIQFICREIYDLWIQQIIDGNRTPSIPSNEIIRKLDSDFFAGRWGRLTDRQRHLMYVIAKLDGEPEEFTVQEVVDMSIAILEKPFGASHVNQMLVTLSDGGLVYKNRWGKYSFAVPLMGRFIRRQIEG